MIVGFDIQAAIDQKAGVARYVYKLARHLEPESGADKLELRCFRSLPLDGLSLWEAGTHNLRVTRLPFRLVRLAWKKLSAPPYDLLTGKADVMHFPDFVVPPVRKGRVVTTSRRCSA